MNPLTDEERSELAAALSRPAFGKAVELALSALWRSHRGAATIEQSAMAFQFYDGACEVINKLNHLADRKETATVKPQRLRPSH